MRYATRRRSPWPVAGALAVLGLLPAVIGCQRSEESERDRETERASRRAAREAARAERAAPYQSEVEESLGAAVAILVDTSGSMRGDAPGDKRPKSAVAREAIEAMLDATDAFVAKRPDFPIKVGLYSFSSNVRPVLRLQPYDRERLRAALDDLPKPGGGTAIGEALREARPDLYRAGLFRKYLIVVTDGDNTSGRSPDSVAREIWKKSEGGVQTYFVAFDTEPEKFKFLKEVGGDVIGANTGAELHKALDGIYQGKILAEAPAPGTGEREPVDK